MFFLEKTKQKKNWNFARGAAMSTVTVGGGMFLLLSSWNAWNSAEIVSNGKLTAATIESQVAVKDALDKRQIGIDATNKDLSDDITQLKIDIGTTKELLKLMSPRFQIDPDAVETRVTKEIASSTEEK